MPYNKDGSHKKNPTKQEWQAYHARKGTAKPKRRVGKSGARGGTAIGSASMGGGAGGGGGG